MLIFLFFFEFIKLTVRTLKYIQNLYSVFFTVKKTKVIEQIPGWEKKC